MTEVFCAATPTPSAPRIEHHAPGRLGIGESRPRLSWRIDSADAAYRQRAARIEVVRRRGVEEPTSETVLLDGDEQILVPWPSATLGSRERIDVRVQVLGPKGWSQWSTPTSAETGLLDPSDWTASFVGPGHDGAAGPLRPPGRVRTEFSLPEDVVGARLHLSGHGLVQAEINGRRVGDEELTPGWTSYRHRLRYATFDVGDLLQSGANAMGVWLGDGWWRGHLGFGGGTTEVYGDTLAALVQLEVLTADGERLTIVSDSDWTAGPGPIVSSGLYDGERVDLRRHDAAWSTSNYADVGWRPVTLDQVSAARLIAPLGPPIRCTEELRPVAIEKKEEGRFVLDFGQNHSGRLRIRTAGPRGSAVLLRHAEVLVDGELATEPLRGARATDEVVLPGGEVEWEPRFTLHGYRYAEVSGWHGPLEQGDVVSRVLHSDLERRGWFESSNPLLDRLHENVGWSLRSNFVDIPTDCPQRDERLGWTGDLQVFAPTAAFLYDVSGFLASWLQDLAVEQAELDWVPPWIPYFDIEPFASLPRDPSAVWGDVALLTPDVLHQRTGDERVLRDQYASAVAWLDHVERAAGADRICRDSEQLGDWLDPAAPPENPFLATTDKYLVATAYFARSARRLAAMAVTLGEEADARRYTALADEVAAAYAEHFLLPGGRATSDTQTAYSLTTVFDLWPDEEARQAGTERLAELVRAAHGTIATGFAGTPIVTDALSGSGHLAEAYALLESTDSPSWLSTVERGGTTIWERWDSLLPDGSINSSDMTSFNHYALGSVADWMHRVVAGIAPAAPGYRSIRFEPHPGGSLTRASATHLTPYGNASISWEIVDDRLRGGVTVPVGASAELVLPASAPTALGHGEHTFDVPFAQPSGAS